MLPESCILDENKLEGLRPWTNGSFVSRCPVCASENRDSKKSHLFIFFSGKFHCVASPDHAKGVYQLAGKDSNGVLIERETPQPIIEQDKVWPVDILKNLVKDYSYWLNRGVSMETCYKYQIGIAVKHSMAGRSVLPIFNEKRDKIIGFTGRKLNNSNKDSPKWKHLGMKTNWILNHDIESIRKSSSVILVESPGDVLWLDSRGITNVVCLFGVVPSGKLISYLIKCNPARILISTNNEASSIGNKAAESIRETLCQFFSPERLTIALPIGAKDFGEKTEEQLSEWREKYLDVGGTT